MTLKVGAVGIGNIFSGAHLPGWMSHRDTEVIALCDLSRTAAEAAAKDVAWVQIYDDYRELLADPSIDIVDICTPNLYHAEMAIAALQRGKHVFCEKPDAISPGEAQKMADAARASGKLLMTMRNNRFSERAQFANRITSQGQLGELYMGRGGWFTTKALSGGGPLIDLGVHMIDLALWLGGNPQPVTVSGTTYRKFADQAELSGTVPQGIFDVEDLAAGFIRFENGASLQIEFSWASNIAEDQKFVEWRGTQGGFSLINNNLRIFTESAGTPVDLEPQFPGAALSPHTANIHHFIECILNRETPIITPDQGVDMLRILTAIYKSAESGREIRL